MASQVEIVNLALVQVGGKRLASLTEATEEAAVVSTVYDYELDAMLSEHAWGFATRTLILALTADTYTEWDYAYAYPSDCLQVLGLVNENTGAQVEYADGTIRFATDAATATTISRPNWDIGVSNDGLSRRILCNEEDAEIRYIARVTDVNQWWPTFRTAFAFRLAIAIVMPLKNDPQKLQMLTELYGMHMRAALAADAKQCNMPLPTSTPSIDARNA